MSCFNNNTIEEIWKYGDIRHIKREIPIELGDWPKKILVKFRSENVLPVFF